MDKSSDQLALPWWEQAEITTHSIAFTIVFVTGLAVYWRTKELIGWQSVKVIFQDIAVAFFMALSVILRVVLRKEESAWNGYLITIHRCFLYYAVFGTIWQLISFKRVQVQLNAQEEETRKIIRQINEMELYLFWYKVSQIPAVAIAVWYRLVQNDGNTII